MIKWLKMILRKVWYTTCLKKTAISIELLTNTFLIPFLLFQLFVGLSFYVPFQNSKTCSIKMCDSFCSIDNRSTIVLCFHLHQLGRCVSNFWNSVYKTVDINISVLCFCLVSLLSYIFKWKVVFPVEKTQPKHDILMKWKVFESLWFGFVISTKKMLFVLGLAHGDPLFAKVGPKNGNF